MRRVASQPRPNWQDRVERLGLRFHTGGEPYWYESAHYVLSSFEVNTLEAATNPAPDVRRRGGRPEGSPGSWMVGQESAGVGVRESSGPISTNRSRFVPHRME